MLRFAANLSTLFTELPLRARFTAARMAGFAAVECQFPYELSPGEVEAELEANGLRMILLNAPPGDFQAGERGLAALRGREQEFENSIRAAFDYAEAVGCSMVHVMAGVLSPMEDRDHATGIYIDNLRRAAVEAERRGITIIIEPINQRDMPGYLLSRTEAARRVIETVDHPSLGLLFDVYHRQVSQGDVTHALREHFEVIRHVQIANPPDRCAPGRGELDLEHFLEELQRLEYAGHVGCEYFPGGPTRDSLGWFERWRPLRKARA